MRSLRWQLRRFIIDTVPADTISSDESTSEDEPEQVFEDSINIEKPEERNLARQIQSVTFQELNRLVSLLNTTTAPE